MHTLNDIHSSLRESDLREVDDRLLLWPEVQHQTGLSRTTAWRMERTSGFPARVQLSPGRVGWWESEVSAWKMSRRLARLAETARGRGRTRTSGIVDSPPGEEASLSPRLAKERVDGPQSDPASEGPATQHSAQPIPGPAPDVALKRPRRADRVSPGQMGFDF